MMRLVKSVPTRERRERSWVKRVREWECSWRWWDWSRVFLQESDESALESKEQENQSALGDDETGQECSCKRALLTLGIIRAAVQHTPWSHSLSLHKPTLLSQHAYTATLWYKWEACHHLGCSGLYLKQRRCQQHLTTDRLYSDITHLTSLNTVQQHTPQVHTLVFAQLNLKLTSHR